MNIFVTGGAGYIGSHCVRRLLAAGHRVSVFDDLSFGHRAALDPQAAFIQGNVGDAAALDRALSAERFDAVIHFAAFINVGESVEQPLKYYTNNTLNTLQLLDAMRRHEIRRIVFSSTCAVVGLPERLPITEDLPRNPINPYGHSKLCVEFMLADCAAAWGLAAVALRYFNAAGAAPDGTIGEDHSPETHLIPLVLQVALGRRDRIKVLGADYDTPDGSCVRDYIHVEDLSDAHVLAVAKCTPGRLDVLNVGTGRGFSVFEVIDACRAVTGHPIPHEVVARRPGDPASLYADPSRTQGALGWQPRYRELNAIVETAWKWHKSHPQGYAGA